MSTHRYLYKVSALYKLLQEPSSIPLDLVLHGYYGTQCRPCKRSVLKCMHVLAHVCACVCVRACSCLWLCSSKMLSRRKIHAAACCTFHAARCMLDALGYVWCVCVCVCAWACNHELLCTCMQVSVRACVESTRCFLTAAVGACCPATIMQAFHGTWTLAVCCIALSCRGLKSMQIYTYKSTHRHTRTLTSTHSCKQAHTSTHICTRAHTHIHMLC